MNSKQIMYAIRSEKYGYMKNPKYDEKDYLSSGWDLNRGNAYLYSKKQSMRAMMMDLDRKYVQDCIIEEIIVDKFVHFEPNLYDFLIAGFHNTKGFFSFDDNISKALEIVSNHAVGLSENILTGEAVEKSWFKKEIESLKKYKAVIEFSLEFDKNEFDVADLEEDLEILVTLIENYKLAYTICDKTILEVRK